MWGLFGTGVYDLLLLIILVKILLLLKLLEEWIKSVDFLNFLFLLAEFGLLFPLFWSFSDALLVLFLEEGGLIYSKILLEILCLVISESIFYVFYCYCY